MTTFAIPAPAPQQGVFATVTLEPHELPVGTLAQAKIRALTDYLRWMTLATSVAFPSTGPTQAPPPTNLPEQYETMMLAVQAPGVVSLP